MTGVPVDRALASCIERARSGGLTMEEALESLGPASFCFVCLLLSVLFLQPFSLGPITMASGITFMACGWQMARGHDVPRLPKSMRARRVEGKGWLRVLLFCQKTLAFCRTFTRPRLQGWVTGQPGERLIGWLIAIGGFLLALPAANLPFNNTLPALMVLFAALAWLERDGLMVLVSIVWGALTVAYFILVGKLAWLAIVKIIDWLQGR